MALELITKNLPILKPGAEEKKSKKEKSSGKNKIIGQVKYHQRFKSNYVEKERDIIVWLPPSYNKSVNNYPVLYMHDGQNLMDPKTAYVGYDWRVDEVTTQLIKQNKIHEIIVVGIYNTPDRLEEYSDSEKGERYRRFIVSELKPFIDENYRTITSRESTAIMGSSMGGLCSMLMILNYSQIFSKAACLSSSFYYHHDKIFRSIQNIKSVKRSVKIYLDSGEDGKYDAQKMFFELSLRGFKIGEDIDYFYDAGAQHTELDWAKRLDRPLKFFFGK